MKATTSNLSVNVSSRNQKTLLAAVRNQLGIGPGDTLLSYIRGGHLILVPEPEDVVSHLRGLHREVWKGIDAQEYVNQERDAWRR